MGKYKIGDFAAQLGVTPDLLKHYEKYNIISSEKQGEGGYRFYDFTQSTLILESKKLQRLGFSLREIENLLHRASSNLLVESLTEKIESITEEIKDKQLILKHAQYLRKIAQAIKNDSFNGDWYIGELPSYFFFPHSMGFDFKINSPSVLSGLSDWINSIPVTVQCAHIHKDPSGYSKLTHGLYADVDDAEDVGLYIKDPVKKVPAGWGLIYHSTQPAGNGDEQGFITRILETPFDIMEKHNFICKGDICVLTLLETIENNVRYLHRIIMIPLDRSI